MTHLFRPSDVPDASSPPVGLWKWQPLAVAWRMLLAWASATFLFLAQRVTVGRLLMLCGVVVQAVTLAMCAYLVDLSVSLFELWAELARKHLELTL